VGSSSANDAATAGFYLVEVLLAEDGELIVRSASRLGEGDLGVNARRLERLRNALAEAGLLVPAATGGNP